MPCYFARFAWLVSPLVSWSILWLLWIRSDILLLGMHSVQIDLWSYWLMSCLQRTGLFRLVFWRSLDSLNLCVCACMHISIYPPTSGSTAWTFNRLTNSDPLDPFLIIHSSPSLVHVHLGRQSAQNHWSWRTKRTDSTRSALNKLKEYHSSQDHGLM